MRDKTKSFGKPLGLDDPLLGHRLSLPGVTRFVRRRAIRSLSVGMLLVSIGAIVLAWGVESSGLLLIAAVVFMVTLPASAILSLFEAIAVPAQTLPGSRAGVHR